MKSIILDDKNRRILRDIVKGKNNSKAKLKAKVILLRAQRKSIAYIMNETKLCKRTIINYTNQYINSTNKMMFFYYKGNLNQSELSKNKELCNEFIKHPPLTYKEATQRIEHLTGIKRSQTQVRNYLNKHNIYTKNTRAKIKYGLRQKIEYKTRLYLEELKSEEICNEFTKRPPITYKEAAQRIEKLTGLKRSELQVKKLLNKYNIYTSKSRKKESQNNSDFQEDNEVYSYFI